MLVLRYLDCSQSALIRNRIARIALYHWRLYPTVGSVDWKFVYQEREFDELEAKLVIYDSGIFDSHSLPGRHGGTRSPMEGGLDVKV